MGQDGQNRFGTDPEVLVPIRMRIAMRMRIAIAMRIRIMLYHRWPRSWRSYEDHRHRPPPETPKVIPLPHYMCYGRGSGRLWRPFDRFNGLQAVRGLARVCARAE